MRLTKVVSEGKAVPFVRRQGRTHDVAYAFVLLIALAAIITGSPAVVRAPMTLAALLMCPGYAVVRRMGPMPMAEAATLTIAASLSVNTILAYLQVVSGWWHPAATLAVSACASGTLLLKPSREWDLRDWREHQRGSPLEVPTPPGGGAATAGKGLTVALVTISLAGLIAWLVTWISTAPLVRRSDMGLWGLLPLLPDYWYIGLAAVVSTCFLAEHLSAELHRWFSPVLATILILYLYGTAPALEGTPRYTWAYKHIGVVRYILEHHQVDPDIDIYHRWPGMFSLASALTTLSGVHDPTSVAAWSELFFTLLDVLIMYSLARRFAGPRGAWTACYFFIVFNWVGQQYFSPQALAYTLALALVLIITILLPADTIPGFAGRVLGWHGFTGEFLHSTLKPAPPRTLWANRYLYGLAVLIDTAIVVSHQLTPYILLLVVGLLTIFHSLRPRWLVLILAVITVGYLIPNVDFVRHNYGLFTALNPLDNVKSPPPPGSLPSAKVWQGRLALGLTLLAWMTAVLGVAGGRSRLPSLGARWTVGLVFVAPFLTLLAQSYGGEARMRVLLFSLPACSIGAAWLWDRFRLQGIGLWRWTAASVTLPISCALFVCVFFGQEDVNYVPASEVTAANWLYQHAAPGEVLMLSTPGFPSRYGANYPNYPGPVGDNTPTLELDPVFAKMDLSREALNPRSVIAIMGRYSGHGYLIFSSTQARFARANGSLGGLEGYRNLQRSVADSGYFRLVYANRDVTVYQVL